jgi:uncharacterized protein (DUF1499 family)
LNILGIIALLAVVGGGLFIGVNIYWAKQVPQPENVGKGEITPCPSSKNCVSTVDTDADHGIQPISYSGTVDEAKNTLLAAIEALPKAQIITHDGNYLHVLVRSQFFGYPDDVEFVFDDDSKVIRCRSAARMGEYDFDKNRERMNYFRQAFS